MTEFDGLSEHLFPLLEAQGLQPAELRLFRPISDLLDNPIKLSIHDSSGHCNGILQWSPPGAVHAVADAVRRAEAARRKLGDSLGDVVLAASLEGEFLSRSFAMFPLQRTLSERRVLSRLHGWICAPSVLGWLNQVHLQAFAPLAESEYGTRVISPLGQMRDTPGLSGSLPAAIEDALAAVESGRFTPWVGPIHNDLWRGNILLPRHSSDRPSSGRRFLLIDWGASTLSGFPLWDLLRALRSLQIPDRWARRILRRECGALGMSLEDGQRSLLLALADLGVNRNEFPLDLYLQAAAEYHAYFEHLAS